MADQAITALPKKTYSGSSKIAATDYLLGIDSAEGYQMLIQDLGEYIINRVTASLAGSTQTLASAISALNSNMSTLKNMQWLSNVDLNTFTSDGIYFIAANITNCYTGSPWSPMRVFSRGGVDSYRQLMLAQNGTFMYRYQTGSNTWSDWVQLPTRAEVDALSSKSIHITGNLSTFQIPVPSKQPNAYHTVMIYGDTGNNANDAFMYLVFINVDAQNQVIVIPIKAHGSITITGAWDASTKVLTLTSSAVIYGGLWALT